MTNWEGKAVRTRSCSPSFKLKLSSAHELLYLLLLANYFLIPEETGFPYLITAMLLVRVHVTASTHWALVSLSGLPLGQVSTLGPISFL